MTLSGLRSTPCRSPISRRTPRNNDMTPARAYMYMIGSSGLSCSMTAAFHDSLKRLASLVRALLIFIALLPALLSSGAGLDRSMATGVAWISGYDMGMRRARALKRPAFIYFDAAWCSWCQQYQRETLSDPAVRRRLTESYVAVIEDFDARPDLMKRFNGFGLPFTLVLTPDEQILNRFVGILSASDLIDLLDDLTAAAPLEAVPAPGFIETVRVTSLDQEGYHAFQREFMMRLESLYDPKLGTLAARYETGASLKRPSPLTWRYLRSHRLWIERARRAARVERERLFDAMDGGFFNFLDPASPVGEYLESSKLLEANAWLTAWQAEIGRDDRAARTAALATWTYLNRFLRDPKEGGYWQAQLADARYYAMPPDQRRRSAPPPVDAFKRADTNAQASWALVDLGCAIGAPAALDDAAHVLDFVLSTMVRDNRLYHIRRAGALTVPALPEDLFWVLAAGHAVEAVRPSAQRAQRLQSVAPQAAAWLKQVRSTSPATPLSNEVLGLIAWVAGANGRAYGLPQDSTAWSLRQLRIDPDTPPDDLIVGLQAWERLLGISSVSETTRRCP